eukprot:2014733-Pyramimonas_sp.AAC.1
MSAKIGMARWFGWVDTARAFLPMWHRRLLTLTFMCMLTGTLETGKALSMLGRVATEQKSKYDEDVKKTATSHEPDDVAKLRRAAQNAAHLACICLGDQSLLENCRIIVTTMGPLRQWHTEQSTTLRSTKDAKD